MYGAMSLESRLYYCAVVYLVPRKVTTYLGLVCLVGARSMKEDNP
jgi:hypothetical protein